MATIEKRGNGYKITVSDGYDVNGKQVRHRMTWTPDPSLSARQIKKELQRQAILFEDKCKSGISGGHVKLSNFIDQYFEEYAARVLRERTRASYAAYVPRVKEALGHLYLDKITPRHIKSFVLNLAEPGINQRHPDTGLSQKSIKNYLGFLSSVFSYAMDLEMIPSNPCTRVSAPAVETSQEKVWYTLEEAQELLDSLRDAPAKYRAYVTLAVFCGYRREELGGLEWRDIDFDKHTISIARAYLYTKDRGVYTDVPKTKAAVRIQKQQPIVFEALRQWRAEQASLRIAVGDLWQDTGRVFTGDFGAPLHPNTTYNWLKRHCQNHGIRFLGIHALRHLNAALRISAGADVRTVAAAMGHAQASTTLNIYAYQFASAQAESSEAVSDLLTAKKKQSAKPEE